MAVALYSTPTCAYCRKAKEYLRERKVQFTEYNVATNQAKADEMMKKSGQMGVPVIYMGALSLALTNRKLSGHYIANFVHTP
jgi:glutaredoxin